MTMIPPDPPIVPNALRPSRSVEVSSIEAGRTLAGQPLDDVAVGDADLDLVVAGFLDVAADGDHSRALGLLGASLGVLGPAVADDPGHRRQRLDVVDRGGHAPGALQGRERRT